MTLTNDQQNALANFTAFMLSDARFMVLRGPAGTGKTFVLKEMIQSLKEPNGVMALMGGQPIKKAMVTATTNKAAEVLFDAMRGTKGVKEVTTIHSAMKLSIKNDFDNGTTRLVKSKEFQIVRNTLIVIDECSMVDKQLLKILKEGTVNCKFLFMGDECQLASIFEDESEVFALDGYQVQMEEPVRNRGVPALGAVCKQLRTMVKTSVFTPVVPDGQAIVYLTNEEMQNRLRTDFILQDSTNKRILAYSNNRVQTYNAYIREERGLPREFQPGETLVCNNVVMHDGTSTRVEQLFTVKSTGAVYHDPDMLKEFGWEIPVYKVTTSCGESLIQPVDYEQVTWALKQLQKHRAWEPYFRFKQRFSDLRMPQASTVYKAQGSTYDEVYIDLGDIGNCRNPMQTLRMLYVAYSRAAKRVFLFGALPPRYMGVAA